MLIALDKREVYLTLVQLTSIGAQPPCDKGSHGLLSQLGPENNLDIIFFCFCVTLDIGMECLLDSSLVSTFD